VTAGEPSWGAGAVRVGVIGGGVMGTGLVQSLLNAGFEVVLCEVSVEASEQASQRLGRSLERAPHLSATPDALLARLTSSARIEDVAGVELVVETVPESLKLKQAVLSRIAKAVSAETTIGTNTSSLSINELAGAAAVPSRVVGLHFFNPVPASALVEVVRGAATSPKALEVAHNLAERLGKTSIEVADSPGFATSRLGVVLGLEAVRMLEEGVASVEDIDCAMVLGYKHPMGPLRLTDLVGLDVRLGIAEYLSWRLGARFTPPDLMRRMVVEGRLGKKSGRGFYEWP
jgi:3-hydroxybutyryl-CoA dehydrogenase